MRSLRPDAPQEPLPKRAAGNQEHGGGAERRADHGGRPAGESSKQEAADHRQHRAGRHRQHDAGRIDHNEAQDGGDPMRRDECVNGRVILNKRLDRQAAMPAHRVDQHQRAYEQAKRGEPAERRVPAQAPLAGVRTRGRQGHVHQGTWSASAGGAL